MGREDSAALGSDETAGGRSCCDAEKRCEHAREGRRPKDLDDLLRVRIPACGLKLGVSGEEVEQGCPGAPSADRQSRPVEPEHVDAGLALRCPRSILACRRQKAQMVERLLFRGVEQERPAGIIERESAPFEVAVAARAGEQVVVPVEGSLGIRQLGPEVLDVSSFAVLAVHATFETAGHPPKAGPDLLKSLSRLEFPQTVNLSLRIGRAGHYPGALLQELKGLRAQGQPLEPPHTSAANLRRACSTTEGKV